MVKLCDVLKLQIGCRLVFDPASTGSHCLLPSQPNKAGLTVIRFPQPATAWLATCPDYWRNNSGIRGERLAWHCCAEDTPIEIIDKLNKEINVALADPKIKTRLFELGGEPLELSAADFGRLITAETDKWSKVIRGANIKPN